jgi:hypothetical protein
LNGDETVVGAAMVGGTHLNFGQNKVNTTNMTTLAQSKQGGVPVLVNPVLLPNEMES